MKPKKQLKKQQNNIYYNWDKAYSYNALFHLIITERGLGKTYGKIIKDVKAFVFKDYKSIYLSMFSKEVDKSTPSKERYQYSIWKTLLEINAAPDPTKEMKVIQDLNATFTLEGRHIFIKLPEYDEPKIMFSCYSLNEAESIKKLTELKTYKNINLDECIRFDKYTPNIIDKILTIYDTVDRRRFITRLFLMGNAITMFNPYFEGFNLKFTDKDLIKDNGFVKNFTDSKGIDRLWLVHISNNKAYQKERAESAINKLAGEDAKYIKMASEGQFVYDNDQYVIATITSFERPNFALIINEKEVSFSKFRNGYYLHTKQKAQRLLHYKEPSRESVPLRKEQMSRLKALYVYGMLFFENIDIKNNFIKEYIGRYY